jgi:hypothetical protein
MIAIRAGPHRAATKILGALACVSVAAISAHAQGRLTAHYTITMTGISIGQIVWRVDIGDKLYATSANGKASGVLSVLVNGDGSVASNGNVVNGQLAPAKFTSSIVDDEGNTELQMTFAGGVAKERITQGPAPKPDRLPVTDAERRGVSDPLTAMLIPVKAGADFLASSNCSHLLPIFDGRRRYNLALAYARIDNFKSASGYSGPVLVCGVILQPIAGYRPDSMLVKYVAGRRDMELWFAPVAGTSILAPIRVLLPTLIGTLKIQADQFESVALSPSHATTSPAALPR